MISSFTLENGIRVVCENIPHAHSVSIGIWVASGSRHECRELNGIAHFIEHMLFKGTERRSALDIAREMDSVGGVLNAFTSREYVCYYAKVLHKALPRALDLLSDIFLNSVLDEDELEKERKVILQEIRMLEDTPDDLIHDLLTRSFWEGSALGMSILGTEESVSRITRDNALEYKASKYRGEQIVISVAGRIQPQELRALVTPLFSGVPRSRAEKGETSPAVERKVRLVPRELEQVHFCLGLPALPQSSPRRYAGYLLNTILGGGMSSRLFQEIREKKGLAYSVYSYISSYSDSGSLVIYAGTSENQVEEAVDIILAELRRLKDEPVSVVELEAAREQFKGNLLLSLESSDNRMTKLAKNEIYFGRNISVEEITEGFDAVSAEDLTTLACDLFDAAASTLVVIGDISGLNLTDNRLDF